MVLLFFTVREMALFCNYFINVCKDSVGVMLISDLKFMFIEDRFEYDCFVIYFSVKECI